VQKQGARALVREGLSGGFILGIVTKAPLHDSYQADGLARSDAL